MKSQTWKTLGVCGGLLCLFLFASAGSGETAPEPEKKAIRVGTYENRAIAIAYASSEFNSTYLKGLKKQLDQAKAENNSARVKEIEGKAQRHQRQMHFKGFGHFPVQDLLGHIKDSLPAIAKEAKVDLIAWEVDYQGENVELVDVTMLLVKRFNPKAKAYKWISQIKGKAPISLEVLEKMKD